MSHQVAKVRRDAVAPCMTCPLCHKLLRDATTVTECLHTFCRKCIYKKLADEVERCPICNIDLGCVPLEKLRLDHNLQDVRSKIFPCKRINARAPEVETAVTLPAKRKERSLSSLVSPPIVSTHNGMTGRRSKSTARKASKGARFTIEKHVKREESMYDHPEGSGSPEPPNKFARNMGQSYAPGEPSNCPRLNKAKDNGSEAWEGRVGFWKPLNCLLEAVNRSKSSNFCNQGSDSKLEALPNNEGYYSRTNNKEPSQKPKVQNVKSFSENTPPESEKPKKLCKICPKKPRDFGELKLPPSVVLDAASAKCDRPKCPIWFSLVSDEREGDVMALPQISSNYLRIKDGNIPVSFIQKYLKTKLALNGEDEVEIKCMGQPLIPTLTLSNLLKLWLQTTTTDRVSATVGSSAKEFVMVLGYARKLPIT